MIDPFEVNLMMPANGTEPGLLVQPDGFGLHATDKKEHGHRNYT
jgi:hypothetical protein